MKGWNATDLEKASKPDFAAPVERSPSGKGKTPPKPREAKEPAENTPPLKAPAAYHAGPYRLAVANGTHYPGRVRIVLVGPASDTLPAALVAALTQFTSTP